METIHETYTRILCSNCKNRYKCQEELRKDIKGTLKCCYYIKDKQTQGYRKFEGRLANQNKPIMRL